MLHFFYVFLDRKGSARIPLKMEGRKVWDLVRRRDLLGRCPAGGLLVGLFGNPLRDAGSASGFPGRFFKELYCG